MNPPSSTSLPTAKVFLTSLLSSLSNHPSNLSDSTLPLTSKPVFLTLHALFPTLLLPALDLLDRHLITRLVLQTSPPHNQYTPQQDETPSTNHPSNQDETSKNSRSVYYVKSSTHSHHGRSRHHYRNTRSDIGATHYEVRTQAWNCTCAAFAFSAYNGYDTSPPIYELGDGWEGLEEQGVRTIEDEEMLDMPNPGLGDGDGQDRGGEGQWGGLMLGEQVVPLCKHLLACVLVERVGIFGGMIEEREVGREEVAGWAAGWGG